VKSCWISSEAASRVSVRADEAGPVQGNFALGNGRPQHRGSPGAIRGVSLNHLLGADRLTSVSGNETKKEPPPRTAQRLSLTEEPKRN